jgi:hypothetical protein
MTRWAQPLGDNGRTGGSGIIVLSDEDARTLAEAHADTSIVERYFGAEEG